MKKVLIVLVLLAAVFSLSGSAFAWTIPNTYWNQGTSDTGGSLFDRINLVWLTGAQLASPAMTDRGGFSSWSVSGDATQAVAVTAIDSNDINFDINFLGAAFTATSFLLSVSRDDTTLVRYFNSYPSTASPNVNSWHWESVTQDQWNRLAPTASPVPEPATMALLGMGVLGLVGLKRKA